MDTIKPVKFEEGEESSVGIIMNRLWQAIEENNRPRSELNGKTRYQYHSENERIANTVVEKRTADTDIVVSSGTVEQKLFAVVAELNSLNLGPEVRAFDKDNNELIELGMALTDVITDSEEREDDEENKLIRQVELLKQGTVFIQENWVVEYKTKKELNSPFIGKIKDVVWKSTNEKSYEGARRQILFGPGVYLGNVKEFTMKLQPFIFTHKITSYSEAESRFGGKDKDGKLLWERWESVPKKIVQIANESSANTLNLSGGFSIVDLQSDQVEEIHYQDKFKNEYQIFLNGIPMLPQGFPLTVISPSGEYNIEKQVYQVINPFFALGKSFVAKTANLSDLLDEMLRLLILKTRKSVHPPYANISGRVISSKSLMPGRITMGIDPGALVKIGEEGQGATAAEFNMFRTLQDNVDNVTVSPQFQGQQGKSGTTATEVNTLTQQAQKVLSLTIFAASMFERKIGYLRLWNLLANEFKPQSQEVDDLRKTLKNKYRTVTRNTAIEGRGQGIRKIIPTDDELPDSEEVFNQEEYQNTPEGTGRFRRKTRGELQLSPIQIIHLNPKELQLARLMFFIEVESREKNTGINAKFAFREQLRDIQALMTLGSRPNITELEDEYALVWGKRKDRLFQEAPPPGIGLPDEESGVDTQAMGNILNASSGGAPVLAG